MKREMNDGITSGKIPTLPCYNNHFVQCQSRIFPLSFAVIQYNHSFLVSLLFIAWIPKFLACLVVCYLYNCNCSIKVTAVLKYLESAFTYHGACHYFKFSLR